MGVPAIMNFDFCGIEEDHRARGSIGVGANTKMAIVFGGLRRLSHDEMARNHFLFMRTIELISTTMAVRRRLKKARVVSNVRAS